MVTQLTPAQFIAKWKPATLPERAASQEHFIDLCRLLGQPTPAEHDATGTEYTFEKGVTVTGPASRGSKGEYGYADVWWRGKFAWEYKRKDKYRDLAEAYRQLCQYREALDNPPLLIVSDIGRIEIHTNFTATRKEVHTIRLDHIGHPESLDKLRRVFADPLSFKPTLSTFHLTENAAAEFAKIADQLRQRAHDPHIAAHFLMKCMFCLFAEDVKLLPEALFSRLLQRAKSDPAALTTRLNELFQAMKDGGYFGVENIAHFDGGLFDDAPPLPLKTYDIHTMLIAGQFDWGSVEPSIFGTLFERSLDPSKRSQIGAHYTSREDIMLIVEPVVMAPLRREWQKVQDDVAKQLQRRASAKSDATKRKANEKIAELIQGFQHRLGTLRILDPACGSGNFLYVALQELLSLEKEVIVFASKPEIGLGLIPQVRPTQLHGLEINPFAAELAQVVIWIGYLQWMKDNGFLPPSDPILAPLQTIECRDAVLDPSEGDHPTRPVWPDADFIIGNPPFCGSQRMIEFLGEDYTNQVRNAYTLPHTSDYCCYWFQQGLDHIRRSRRRGSPARRVGLLATQAIRGAANRTVIERIKAAGDLFLGWSDRDWVLDGALVHVSMIGFDDGTEQCRALDGHAVDAINADLSSGIDVTAAKVLVDMRKIAFQGPVKVGKFELPYLLARKFLASANPHGRPNRDVVRPYITGAEIADRIQGEWIVDFDDMREKQASLYEQPFEHVRRVVKPDRDSNRDTRRRTRWWLHGASGKAMRRATRGLSQYAACCRHMKHWIFRFFDAATFPDSGTVIFARDDMQIFGCLQSSIHELWARAQISQVREAESGFRYTSRYCLERFPLPWPPDAEPVAGAPGSDLHERIGATAKELNEQRERWLNPSKWIDAMAQYVDNKHDFSDVPAEARHLIRQSAIMAEAARDPRLKKRTLTDLYNERPTWLRLAHEKLDRAVLAAYAAVDPEGDWSEDWAEVWVETGAGQPLPNGHALAEQRREIDQHVLANLLRLNLARATR